MDTEYNPNNIHGTFTKIFGMASFKKFIVIGDHMIVNIAQSKITPVNTKYGFSARKLVDSTIALINQKGGLNTIYGHNSLIQYDGSKVTKYSRFKYKGYLNNDNIDFIQFIVRNSTSKYGGHNIGSGIGEMILDDNTKLKVGTKLVLNDGGTLQVVGSRNLANPEVPPNEVHEMGHNLLGMSNAIHMGGGGPVHSYGYILTTLEKNGGWSLMGGSSSSLVSCSGFDRWRLGWKPDSSAYPIVVNKIISDITKADGVKSYYLRDFITTGDVIRIKLPYQDAGTQNQYIWL